MKIAFFDTHDFERQEFCSLTGAFSCDITFFETKLNEKSASLVQGFDCVCVFVNDVVNETVIKKISEGGVKLIALRSAGYNHVDLPAAKAYGIKVVRVPEYSPYAVAEHVLALILTLNRKTHRAYNRVREGNFSLSGLVGFDIHGKTFGVIGTGKIGKVLIQIMNGFGADVLAFDLHPDQEWAKNKCTYVSLDELLKTSDIISLHIPLNHETHHIIGKSSLGKMKKGVMLINSGRGGLIDTKSLIDALKSGQVGYAGLDVYEEEKDFFFSDLSQTVLTDDVLARLLTFPNVLLTSHQGFLTKEALSNIAHTTLKNIQDFELGKPLNNEITF